ncbi:MAG TPA: hypothetical protein PLK34_01455 [Candidatus Pacearchaeota archaeon]|nr:hypothetical protein [Candidatus Pacearchaeota archaeon]
MTTLKRFVHELKHHWPFTLSATVFAIILTSILFFGFNLVVDENKFEFFHYFHILASAIVSTGIFYKYKKNVPIAILVGIFSSILIGTISDIILPFLGGKIFLWDIEFHLPILETPILVLGASMLGSIIGIWTKATRFPHFIHVFLSVFASLFYILAFIPETTFVLMAISLAIVFVAVLVPCCIGDMLIPVILLKRDLEPCSCTEPYEHHEDCECEHEYHKHHH